MPLQDKIRKTRYHRHIREKLNPQNIANLEAQFTDSNSLQLPLGQEYLRNFKQASPTLLYFYAQACDVGREEQSPIHRKLQLPSVIKKHQSVSYLIRWLNERFLGAAYIIGNWFASMARFHEPIRGIGFRRLLRKKNTPVYLMDEYLTNQVCPQCKQ